MNEFEDNHFEREVNLWDVRCYVAYPISYITGCEFQVAQKCLKLINVYAINFIP
jgi:transposase-like protein